MTNTPPSNQIEWTDHECALWQTCEIVRDVVEHGAWPEAIPVGFARQIDHDERIFLHGDYQRSWHGSVGDGSYQRSSFFLGGLGPAGVALGAATLGLSAIGNSSRKARARRDATEQWRPFDAGHLYISTHGFYLDPGNGMFAFSYNSLLRADLGGPGVLVATISMDNNTQQQFAITTLWAELIFVAWARLLCPTHPSLHNLGFLPSEFIQRAEFAGVWNSSPMRSLVGNGQ
jgi:hypothetical protein